MGPTGEVPSPRRRAPVSSGEQARRCVCRTGRGGAEGAAVVDALHRRERRLVGEHPSLRDQGAQLSRRP
jgi:hypothetical protein